MADGICKAKLEGDQWIIQTDLDGCGTEFNVDTASEIIDFKVYFMLFEGIATWLDTCHRIKPQMSLTNFQDPCELETVTHFSECFYNGT